MKKFILHLSRIVGFALELLFRASKRRQKFDYSDGCDAGNTDECHKINHEEVDNYD